MVNINILEIKEDIIKGMTNEELLNKYNFKSYSSMKSWLYRNKIKLSELRNKNIVYSKYNDYLYDCDELYYLIGMIASDGTIDSEKGRNRIRILLHKNDVDVLDKIKDFVFENSNEIKYYYSKEKYFTLCISDKRLISLCNKIGIYPNKTKTLELNFNYIPEKYIFSFLRGYFDADGTVTISQSKYKDKIYERKYLRARYCGNEFCMNLFKDTLLKFGIESNVTRCGIDKYSYPFFQLSLKNQENIILFREKLYSNASIYMNRKYRIFHLI